MPENGLKEDVVTGVERGKLRSSGHQGGVSGSRPTKHIYGVIVSDGKVDKGHPRKFYAHEIGGILKGKKKKMKITVAILLAAAVCVFAKSKKADDKVKIAVYYESLCPDSKQFITTQLAPLWRDFRGQIKVKLVPYGKSTHDRVDGKWEFNCHHGPNECAGNKIQACILKNKHLGDSDKLELIVCLMQQANPDKSLETDVAHVDSVNFQCLAQLNQQTQADRINQCAEGDHGSNLLASYGDKTDAVMRPLSFVPTIVINEKFDQAIQNEAFTNLKGAVCRAAANQPASCN
ncbi:GILT-like protein 1 [Eumeta japonica]|uniref:GILT-like protein 1 n=1 Tax=Eumeta variegata TaxID=151549 RepID=A0A4C1T6I4_EUMVA|nr:GILT-like protein 1 [Eumeta japonica]